VRRARTCIVAAGKALIAIERENTDPGIPGANVIDGAVGRGVVHEDGLGVHPFLHGNGRQAGVEMLEPVPGDDDDGNVRQEEFEIW
jgi:hypothetical protein